MSGITPPVIHKQRNPPLFSSYHFNCSPHSLEATDGLDPDGLDPDHIKTDNSGLLMWVIVSSSILFTRVPYMSHNNRGNRRFKPFRPCFLFKILAVDKFLNCVLQFLFFDIIILFNPPVSRFTLKINIADIALNYNYNLMPFKQIH